MHIKKITYKVLLSLFFITTLSHAESSAQAYTKYQEALSAYESNNMDLAYALASEARGIRPQSEFGGTKLTIQGNATYLQEGPFHPDTKSYTIQGFKGNYELNKLFKKIKLKKSPIALVEIYETNDETIINIQNVGKLPLDDFRVFINGTQVASFDQIVAAGTKTARSSAVEMESVSFKEADGFAPQSINLKDQ